MGAFPPQPTERGATPAVTNPMKTLALAIAAALAPALGSASGAGALLRMELGQAEPPPDAVEPPTPAPPSPPPPPPGDMPAPPQDQPAAAVQQPAPPPPGQWVYTAEYGWVWMPYGQAYTNVPAGGAPPNMYIYYPTVGWCWAVAPWVWGWGPTPYYGPYGPKRYGWYGNGYGHWYGYKGGAYGTGWRGASYYQGGQWKAPPRTYPAPTRASSPPKAAHGSGSGHAGSHGAEHR